LGKASNKQEKRNKWLTRTRDFINMKELDVHLLQEAYRYLTSPSCLACFSSLSKREQRLLTVRLAFLAKSKKCPIWFLYVHICSYMLYMFVVFHSISHC
jgi:hypothetical protein